MSEIAWATEHSVETAAPSAFAWEYMTDVKNWDDPPARFKLTGSFTSGSPGTTEIPGQPSRRWRLREVNSPVSYTVEIVIDEAVLLCRWVFTEIPDEGSRLTQQITLRGEGAMSYKNEVERTFAATLAPGMNRIAAAINQAFARDPRHGARD